MSLRVEQLFFNGWWHPNLSVELRQHLHLSNQNKVAQGRGVANNRHG